MHKNPFIHRISLTFIILFLFHSSINPDAKISGKDSDLPDLCLIFDNQMVEDTDSDGVPDAITARILLKPSNNPIDIEVASIIAARLGFETSAMDLPIVINNLKNTDNKNVRWLIIFSDTADKSTAIKNKQECGIKTYKEGTKNILEIWGPSPESRRYATSSFFSRYPYLWEVIGRDTGETWQQMKEEILSLLPEKLRKEAAVRIKSVKYMFSPVPESNVEKRRLERFGLTGTKHDAGEVESVNIELTVPMKLKDVSDLFNNLIDDHKKGLKTDRLNYSGVTNTAIKIVTADGETVELNLPRVDRAQRQLNRSFDSSFFKKKKEFKDTGVDLSTFFTNNGIYKDTDNDKYSDILSTRLVYDDKITTGTVNLAARIGLEGCSITLPFTINAENLEEGEIKELERPLIIGRSNRFFKHLAMIGKTLDTDLDNNEGLIEYSEGFNPAGAYIISGSSDEGEDAAIRYLSEMMPYINKRSPGERQWDYHKQEIEKFFTRKSDAAKAALAMSILRKNRNDISASDLESLKISLYTMRPIEGMSDFLNEYVGRLAEKQPAGERPAITIESGGRLEPAEGFTESYSPEWEVDIFRRSFAIQVLPKIRMIATQEAMAQAMSDSPETSDAGNRLLSLDVRLSEPREVLEGLKSWITESIEKAGIPGKRIKIRIISSYKQGFHWIKDDLLPKLKTANAGRIEIRFALAPDEIDKTRKYWPESVRWLQELYPIDEIISANLDIPLDAIRFVKDDKLGNSIYKFTAYNSDGKIILSEKFSPYTEEINFLDRFPGWGKVIVSKSGFSAKYNDEELCSELFDSDPLNLWKYYQQKILTKLTKQLEEKAGGKLKMEDQPFFDKLKVNVWMSEPDYRLGIDEEIVSSLESFHEDIYLNTLEYFSGLVEKDPEMSLHDPRMAGRWAAPGNIVPYVYLSRTGRGPTMEIVYTGLKSPKTTLDIEFKFSDLEKPVKRSDELKPVKVKDIRLIGIVVTKSALPRQAIYRVEFDSEESLTEAVEMLHNLKEIKSKNVLRDLFAYGDLSSVLFELKAGNLKTSYLLPLSVKPEEKNRTVVKDLSADSLDKALSVVMSPEEALDISRRLGSLPEIESYIAGYSYQGRAVPVLEVGLKPAGKIISLQKMTTFKPTLYLLGRQHANEVSSTNYELKIAWLLANDPEYRKYLKDINVVVEPMENPDGSALAVELQKITPYHMLHAGRYSALGTDIGYHVGNPDSLITEAKVRSDTYDKWLPDIFLNNHGYPSHEWVQQFSNYTPYQFRAYWAPRGWYYFHVSLDDRGHPLYKKAGDKIVSLIAEKMKSDPEIYSANARIYDRYKRWAVAWQPHLHFLEIYDGTNIYRLRRGTTAAKETPRSRLTVLEAIPEAMDETAQTTWLAMSVRQGVLFITAYLDLLAKAEKPIERIEEEYDDAVHIKIVRHRPVRIE